MKSALSTQIILRRQRGLGKLNQCMSIGMTDTLPCALCYSLNKKNPQRSHLQLNLE